MRIRRALPMICLLSSCPGIGVAGNTLSTEDVAKIKQVHSKYEGAWLKGDADGVRETTFGFGIHFGRAEGRT